MVKMGERMMCSTAMPRTLSASAMSERWQIQGTASEHMMAVQRTREISMSRSSAAANSGVRMLNPSLWTHSTPARVQKRGRCPIFGITPPAS
jgi:hypothetical protein